MSVRPIIPGFHPDPSICRAPDDRYYLACSSFEYFPGAPLFRSDDLLEWTLIGNILSRPDQARLDGAADSKGVFGPTLRHHDGRFWYITTNMSDFGRGHLIVHAEDPEGPWSDPVMVPEALGIDPDLAWDDNGDCYLSYVGFGPDDHGLVQARIDPYTGRLRERPYGIWSGTGLAFPEGPHLHRIGDWWYLIIAEGGTERGHCVSVARSTSPSGPFEPHPHNPIFSHRSLAHPVQNAGHADLVPTPEGGWAMTYLGVRPRGGGAGFHVLGRESFLAGVDFVDGWPVVDEERYAPPERDRSFHDDFSEARLHPRWIAPGADPASFCTLTPVELLLRPAASGRPHLLATRVVDERWSATLELGPGDAPVALVLRMDDAHWYAIERAAGRIAVRTRVGPFEMLLAEADAAADDRLEIAAVDVDGAGRPGVLTGPDEILLGVRDADGFRQLARLDGRYLSTEVAPANTGRVVGIRPLDDTATVRRFEYRSGTP